MAAGSSSGSTTPPEAVRTFQIKTVSDMLAKLEWEIEQLQATQFSQSAKSVDISSYFAINAALTAFHVCEWIWHIGTQQQKDAWLQAAPAASKAQGKTRFQVGLKYQCPEFGVCRAIANSFKHLADDQFTDTNVLTDVPVFELSVPATAGSMRAGDPLAQFAKVLMVRSKGGITPAAHVLSRTYGFLEDFCEKSGFLTGSQVSP
ncbi:hypothetical protein [Pseudomonas chlororaphis]|uniref:hypothetical protein n=1 Tax=Pseudomonas chlororaphis TaxID=587753 RepID=UPI0015E03800|nr:hypothetical protein [Pseudomonas chlororaphis]QLL15365.1 hypothetical protein H0I86_09835 [Pseudomonas chlororaphis subsp. aurantiaca]